MQCLLSPEVSIFLFDQLSCWTHLSKWNDTVQLQCITAIKQLRSLQRNHCRSTHASIWWFSRTSSFPTILLGTVASTSKICDSKIQAMRLWQGEVLIPRHLSLKDFTFLESASFSWRLHLGFKNNSKSSAGINGIEKVYKNECTLISGEEKRFLYQSKQAICLSTRNLIDYSPFSTVRSHKLLLKMVKPTLRLFFAV